MKKTIIAFLALMGAYTNVAFAQKPAVVTTNEPGWHKIGQITANFKSTTESIVVLGADEFSSIKLKVADAPINIERLQVFYESGDMEQIDVKHQLKTGAETKSYNLKHPDKDVSKVVFTYRTVANKKGEKAEVELYGLKTNQPAGSDSYRNEEDKVKDEASETEKEIRQEENDVKDNADRTESNLDKKVDKAGNQVSEVAAKVMANIKDQVHEDKVGPNGQTIFIDNHAKYYYIDNAGNQVFVTELQLTPKAK